MKYYISDLHFFRKTQTSDGEKPYPQYIVRGFKSVKEMNEKIIENWNSRVKDLDEVYIIGDFSNGSKEETLEILKRLKGQKYLIVGNYDQIITKNKELRRYFEKIDNYMEIYDEESKIIMCHYPLLWYDKTKNTDYMFHGHIHDVSTDLKIMNDIEDMMREKSLGAHFGATFINTYCEFSNYIPLSKKEWLKIHDERKLELYKSKNKNIS